MADTTTKETAAARVIRLREAIDDLEREKLEDVPVALRAALDADRAAGVAAARGRAREIDDEVATLQVQLMRARLDAADEAIAAAEAGAADVQAERLRRGEVWEKARKALEAAQRAFEAADGDRLDAANAYTAAQDRLGRARRDRRQLAGEVDRHINEAAGALAGV